MTIDESNEAQAQFWATAGSEWVLQRDRFDLQVNGHGLAAIDVLAPKSGETVVDIGCGAGTTTLQLADRVGESGSVRGLDISPTMIEGARAQASRLGVSNVSFSVGDAMVEPFDGDADAVFSRFGVMFFSDASRAFANIRRALRPGGRLGFVCWQSPVVNPWVSRNIEISSRYVEMPFGVDPAAPGPFSLADPDRIRSVLDAAGFAQVAVESREAPATLGATLDEAVEFVSGLMPAVVALAQRDPAASAALRAELKEAFSEWDGPDGVAPPSATWIVSAVQPG